MRSGSALQNAALHRVRVRHITCGSIVAQAATGIAARRSRAQAANIGVWPSREGFGEEARHQAGSKQAIAALRSAVIS